MHNSLSLIVPVHNAENSLGQQVARLLEVLPELTQRFEVLIVDDASTDHTADVAAEISREYPQVKLVSQRRRMGLAAAAKRGSEKATGEVVLVHNEIKGLSSAELRELWNERRDATLRQSRETRAPGAFEEPLINRLSAWGQALHDRPQPAAKRNTELRFSIADLGRTDASHEKTVKAKPVRSFLRHLRELTLGE